MAIIPKNYRKKLFWLLVKSILFSILDLVSIAYLIPLVLMLLDKNKLLFYCEKHHVSNDFLNPNVLIVGVLILVLLFIIKNLLQTKFNVKLYHFLYNMSHELSMTILDKYLKGDYLTFQQQNKGTLIQNVTRVTIDFSTSLLASLVYLISESFTFLVILIALLMFYFKLTLLALIGIGAFAFYIYQIKKNEMKLINETYKSAYVKSSAELLNILEGYIEIKSSGNHREFLDKFKIHNRALNQVTSLLTSSSSNYSKFLEMFLIIGIAGLIFYNVFFSHLTENFMLLSVLTALSIKIIPSLSKMLNSITMVNSHLYTIDILNDVSKIDTAAVAYPDFNATLEFNDIHFEYNSDTPIFENLNFTFERGKIIGIKGITGAGKTTFLHIVAGLLAPKSGSISIDGKVVKRLHFFPFISYVAQQPFLFNGTLLENITMRKRENPDLDYIYYLIENLQLKTLIDQLPNGLETVITHNSAKLSGGQKQRLALLRALYNKPKLLILDEATNQQNEPLEIKIYAFIKKVVQKENITVITVSHNPNIYIACDLVYLLSDLKISFLNTKP
jgi:ABC-type multidrug transport system fused ATPase/permease subunit